MLEKGCISSIQFYMVSLMIVLGTYIIYVPSLSIRFGGRDAWLSPIVAGGIGLAVMLTMVVLNNYFPKQTPIEYLQTIFGKWLGSIFGAYLIWVVLKLFAIIMREVADFTVTAALPRTPPEIITLLMLLVVLYVTRKGIEVICRFTQFVVIIELIQIVASVLLLASKDLDFAHLTPLFENGTGPLLRSSFLVSGWTGELFLAGFFLPFIRVKHGTVKSAFWSVITLTALLFIPIFFVIGVFGDVLGSRMLFGLYEVARYISIAEFLERLDPIVMGSWIMFVFCKLIIFCYAASLGLAQLLRFSDYRPMVSIVCVVAFTMNEQLFVNQGDLTYYFSTAHPPFVFLIEIIFPLLILFTAMLRQKWKGESHAQP